MSEQPHSPVDQEPIVGQIHDDLREATAAMRELAAAIAPVIPHIPAILEMANAWGTGKAVTKTAQAIEGALGRLSKLVLAIAILYAAWRMDLRALLERAH